MTMKNDKIVKELVKKGSLQMQAKLVLGGNFPIVLTWFIQLGQLKFFGTIISSCEKNENYFPIVLQYTEK